MFIIISILYMHFVKRMFSTYCIVRVWYDLCEKKKKKKRRKKEEKIIKKS